MPKRIARRKKIKKRKARKASLRYELILGGAVRKYPDGREVCQNNAAGEREYSRREIAMYDRQNGLCCICKEWMHMPDSSFEHADLRGMGGARRDDRIEIDENPINGAAHYWCNTKKGSKREATSKN